MFLPLMKRIFLQHKCSNLNILFLFKTLKDNDTTKNPEFLKKGKYFLLVAYRRIHYPLSVFLPTINLLQARKLEVPFSE
jgi:hypothetical protein